MNELQQKLKQVRDRLEELEIEQYELEALEIELERSIWKQYVEQYKTIGFDWNAELIPNTAFRAYCEALAKTDPDIRQWIDKVLPRIKTFFYYQINLGNGMLKLMTYDLSSIATVPAFDIDFPVDLCITMQQNKELE